MNKNLKPSELGKTCQKKLPSESFWSKPMKSFQWFPGQDSQVKFWFPSMERWFPPLHERFEGIRVLSWVPWRSTLQPIFIPSNHKNRNTHHGWRLVEPFPWLQLFESSFVHQGWKRAALQRHHHVLPAPPFANKKLSYFQHSNCHKLAQEIDIKIALVWIPQNTPNLSRLPFTSCFGSLPAAFILPSVSNTWTIPPKIERWVVLQTSDPGSDGSVSTPSDDHFAKPSSQ